MKTLKQHLDEALKIGKNLSEWFAYSYQPRHIKLEIKKRLCNSWNDQRLSHKR